MLTIVQWWNPSPPSSAQWLLCFHPPLPFPMLGRWEAREGKVARSAAALGWCHGGIQPISYRFSRTGANQLNPTSAVVFKENSFRFPDNSKFPNGNSWIAEPSDYEMV
uniref:Uncharacterized protein n=1 Tax=Sphaerodactylus townsendi TaxID=933632 RepID=A0ACB8F4P8_9SAUR